MAATYKPLRIKNSAVIRAAQETTGFGLLEGIISALILSVVIATAVTVTNKFQQINYRSSLRQAIAQTIDEDMTEIKLELEHYLYQKKTTNSTACYASSRSCTQSSTGVGTCQWIARNASQSITLASNGAIPFNQRTHKVFSGLARKNNSSLKRIVSIEKPDAPAQANQAVSLLDRSIVRVKYTVEGEIAKVLFDNAAVKTISSIDLSPAAHASCEN